ncbi:ABC transporter ATP-binding protein [Sporosarcina sp. PTS2304]|uniref:ABC transporter ATP-binding protein n=1 Tax=Sporosarcina sp. PTS2304 TaxID=2283194 RepID=UPI000E0DA6D0|nr:ABC transporter ATP-binding protein [Sporosarcina sp. PTS2304]AXH98258.1 ABC transporter ATP-binding protein [Sporosarcina sp. PTS2304]
MRKTVLAFDNVSFHYQAAKSSAPTAILDQVSLRVQEGEFVSIIGPSGYGKSTLFRLVTGLDNPQSGQIFLNGEASANRLGKVGYMPQQDLLMPWRTILENVRLPLELQGKKQAHARIIQLLADFGLAGVEHTYPANLSGGMRQRVSFLRTVLTGSNVLLLDEPFSALDAITRLTMQEWLVDQWQKFDKTILFITHDIDEALFLSDRIFVLAEKPVTTIREIIVPLDRPRTMRDLAQLEMIELKERLVSELRSEARL